ncbi:MAG TPA: MBL fold metallo-hydrolase, partial [Planctomycetota bacterium]|nr:MBL fold metallo-hydrolase [Planctomycetota bacterium]
MKLTFIGATRGVTGSMHILEVNGKRVLLDCGMYQGHRKEAEALNRSFPFDPASIDCMILSHAHIDHSGNIPQLVKHGFKGNIYCTSATRDLCALMLRDSAHIQERDAEYINKKKLKKGQPPVEPTYTIQDAIDSLKNFVGIDYEKPFRLC